MKQHCPYKRRPEFSNLQRMKALQAFNGVYSGLLTTILYYALQQTQKNFDQWNIRTLIFCIRCLNTENLRMRPISFFAFISFFLLVMTKFAHVSSFSSVVYFTIGCFRASSCARENLTLHYCRSVNASPSEMHKVTKVGWHTKLSGAPYQTNFCPYGVQNRGRRVDFGMSRFCPCEQNASLTNQKMSMGVIL